MPDNPQPDALDRATRARLARLATLPVDTSGLHRRLKAALPPVAPAPVRRVWPVRSALVGLAATLVLAVTIGIVLLHTGAAPVLAAPFDMARLHAQVLAEPTTAVSSIAEAQRVLAAKWAQAPDLPASPEYHIKSCCIHDLKARKVACVLLSNDHTPITLVVANAQDVTCPSGEKIERAGRTYVYHQMGDLGMVMTVIADRYVCVMGRTTQPELLAVAAGLKF